MPPKTATTSTKQTTAKTAARDVRDSEGLKKSSTSTRPTAEVVHDSTDDYETAKVGTKSRKTISDEERQAVADLERWNSDGSDSNTEF